RSTAATGPRRGPGSPRTPRPRPRAPGQPAPGAPAPRPAQRAPSRSAWRSPRGLSRGAPLERAHGLRDDPPVVLVPQALPDHVLLQLSPGLGARALGLVERLLDGGRPLLHLRDERSVEKLPEDEQENEEIDHLDDQRHVEADDPAAALARGLRGERARGQPEQRDGRERDAPPPPANAFTHAEVSCAGLSPVGL